MSSKVLCTLMAFGSVLTCLWPNASEAQIVRRFAGGGVQIRAPFVRVNVGPYGGTSVRAPFTAVDPSGRVHVGIGARLLPPPVYAAPPQAVSAQPVRPLPRQEELAVMDEVTLLDALRDATYRLDHRLARLTTGAGWQRHLIIPPEILGQPGSLPSVLQIDELQKLLARYDKVSTNPEYAKIAGLPSFVATHAALREFIARFVGPQQGQPVGGETTPAEVGPNDGQEILPTPAPAEKSEATRGEHSILKRR
ncbi:MAG: hypothetical protein MI725_08735 [Pirellulales bacterium]|nr:hypothetical protein [Pirellulales bacterium]